MDKILAFSTKHEIVQYYCFPKSELGLNKTLSLSKTDRRHISMVKWFEEVAIEEVQHA